MKATSRTSLLEATLHPQKYIKQFLVRFFINKKHLLIIEIP